MRIRIEIYTPQFANGKLCGHSMRHWVVPASHTTAYWIPDPIQYDHCGRCGAHVDDHTFDGIGHACVAPSAAPVVVIPAKTYTFRIPVNERRCRKCKNRSLRIITKPDTVDEVAFCRYCGTEEPA